MINNFKFGRGLINPCKDLLNEYIQVDIEFSRRMAEAQQSMRIHRTVQTQRPDGVVNILIGSSSGLHPTMSGDPHFTRRLRRSI